MKQYRIIETQETDYTGKVLSYKYQIQVKSFWGWRNASIPCVYGIFESSGGESFVVGYKVGIKNSSYKSMADAVDTLENFIKNSFVEEYKGQSIYRAKTMTRNEFGFYCVVGKRIYKSCIFSEDLQHLKNRIDSEMPTVKTKRIISLG